MEDAVVNVLPRRRPWRQHPRQLCVPRRQLVSVYAGVAGHPRILVGLVIRPPGAMVAAMRDIDFGRHDITLRCLQERTSSVAAEESINRSL